MIKRVIAVAAVCLAATLPYLSTLHNYFLGDDFGVVWLLSQKPLYYFPRWFISPWTEHIYGYTSDELRAFPALSFQIAAASPLANHVINIGFHVLCALLVLLIARLVARLSLPASTFAGVLFAVLPIHAETVAWLNGRVDSMPAFFYLGSFLAYTRWRRTGIGWLFWASVALFFCALYSKQTAITMLVTLVLYDLIVERLPVRFSWGWLRPYAPFVLLTGGYLVLRHILFGEFARESTLKQGMYLLVGFAHLQAEYLQQLVLGSIILPAGAIRHRFLPAFPIPVIELGFALLLFLLISADLLLRRSARESVRTARALLWYFGPVWWLVGTAPTFVAGYASTRHIYLASVAFVIVLGLGFNALWGAQRRLWRYASVLGGTGLVLTYTLQLLPVVATWNAAGSLSEKVAHDVEHQAAAARAGSLLVLGVPRGAARHGSLIFPSAPRRGVAKAAFLWDWSVPFAVKPPFTRVDLTKRVFIIGTAYIGHSVDYNEWFLETRDIIHRWARRSDRPPVIALVWDPVTGGLFPQSDVENPHLRDLVLGVADAKTFQVMEKKLEALLYE